MKNIVIALLLAGLVVVSALYVVQSGRLTRAGARADSAEATLKERDEADKTKSSLVQKRLKDLNGRLNATSATADEKSSQVAKLQESLAAAETNASPGNALGNLFKSPEMREMIKAQQKAVMGPMIEKTYAGFFKQLNLPPEQKAGLK